MFIKLTTFVATKQKYLDGEVVRDRLVEASRDATVLCGVDEGSGAKDVVQQVTGQYISLFTLEVKSQLQNLDQVRAVGDELVTVHTSYLKFVWG